MREKRNQSGPLVPSSFFEFLRDSDQFAKQPIVLFGLAVQFRLELAKGERAKSLDQLWGRHIFSFRTESFMV